MPTKQERVDEFLRRLGEAEPCTTFQEAYDLLSQTLNEVENEMTTTPFNPNNWRTDGRMYPPQNDQRRFESDDPVVVRYRSKGHSNWIGANGSISITEGDTRCLDKPGRDGQTIPDLMEISRLNRSSKP